jgi:L-amino acid N-acyltransferase YncA
MSDSSRGPGTAPRGARAAPGGARAATDLRFRRPTDADHPAIVTKIDHWWSGRRLHDLLPRLWFQHFTGTSWVAERPDGTILGFLVGFVSPDRPTVAYVHMIGTDPNVRRKGLGSELYRRFFDDVRAQGVDEVLAITWPGNRGSVGFHRALGFEPDAGPGSRNIYGIVAFPDYDYPGEDRVVLRRRLEPVRAR